MTAQDIRMKYRDRRKLIYVSGLALCILTWGWSLNVISMFHVEVPSGSIPEMIREDTLKADEQPAAALQKSLGIESSEEKTSSKDEMDGLKQRLLDTLVTFDEDEPVVEVPTEEEIPIRQGLWQDVWEDTAGADRAEADSNQQLTEKGETDEAEAPDAAFGPEVDASVVEAKQAQHQSAQEANLPQAETWHRPTEDEMYSTEFDPEEVQTFVDNGEIEQ